MGPYFKKHLYSFWLIINQNKDIKKKKIAKWLPGYQETKDIKTFATNASIYE